MQVQHTATNSDTYTASLRKYTYNTVRNLYKAHTLQPQTYIQHPRPHSFTSPHSLSNFPTTNHQPNLLTLKMKFFAIIATAFAATAMAGSCDQPLGHCEIPDTIKQYYSRSVGATSYARAFMRARTTVEAPKEE